MLVGVALALGYTQYKMKQIQDTVDSVAIHMLEIVKEQYPNVKEEDIIALLNEEKEPSEQTKNIMKQYGLLLGNTAIFPNLNNIQESMIQHTAIIILGIGILGMFAIYIEGQNSKRKIQKIQRYIEQINQKQYTLQMDSNQEDDLSKLSSELYKITVMLKEQAENSKREKEVLQTSISDISHQIKTPLTSISIMLDSLQETKNMQTETRDVFMMEIRKQIEWIHWLIYALLKLSRLDADVVEFQKETIRLKELVTHVIQSLSIPIEIKNQTIQIQGDENARIQADFSWQKEAITNIVKNAIEHTPEGKKITITLEENPLYSKIIVEDEGEGIDKEDMKHIFKRFYKAKNASENSVGIGLALAKSIIEKQGGYITCSSEKGKGSKFEIRYMKEA